MKLKKNTIFVSIASYRDDVCTTTLDSLYTMADKKEHIYVGICQQNKSDEDIDCVSKGYENHPNVRIIRIPYFEAKGPTHARYLCSTLWDGEEYFLQIDSHTKFVKGWDTLCINMITDIKNRGLSKKPVLSHYPKEISLYENYNDNDKSVPRICKSFFNNREMISFMGAEEIDTKNIPYMTPYVAGGMFFCESYFLNELPFDPNLPFLFVGEEILHSIRFYTHGWDIFTPTENIVFHEYTRENKPKIWTDNPYYSDMPAFNKVKHYLKLVDDNQNVNDYLKFNLDKYGLGNRRTLEDYYNFAGIDIVNKKVYKNFCRANNIATEDDILKSNEINHKKEIVINTFSTVSIYILMLVVLIVTFGLIYYFVIKKKM